MFSTTQRALWCFAVIAVASAPIAHAAGPDTLLGSLTDHATGKTVPRDAVARYLWKRGDDISCWNGCGKAVGSQNRPVAAEAAIGNYQWLANLARLERREGIFGRELGSPGYYFYVPIAAKMVALCDARKAGDKKAAQALADNLRAIWAYESLLAIPTARTSTWANLSGNIKTGKGDANWYKGLTVAVAGERWRPDLYLDHDPHGAFLSWALNWQPRRVRNGGRLLEKGKWWMNVVGHLVNKDRYAAHAPPEPFGLTQHDRDQLRAVIKGDPAAVRWAVRIVGEYGVYKTYRIRIRRTTKGTEIVFFHSANGNKPAHAATSLTTTGAWRTIRPGYYRGTGANGGFKVWIKDGTIHATCAQGRGERVSMPELGGKVLYEVDLKGHDVELHQ